MLKERRYDIDWLRVIAMLAVFVYHCTRFFDPVGWHIKNDGQSTAVIVLTTGLFWTWMMPLFFLLAGMGAWYALQSRTGRQYLGERVKRLLLPLYTVGLLLIIPPQFYFEIVTNAGYTGTFREGLWLFYRTIPAEFAAVFPAALDDPGHLVPYGFPGHLWFLQYLFIMDP
jgi:peptidoglycan/LPS O-acetylase OafA/YrhL